MQVTKSSTTRRLKKEKPGCFDAKSDHFPTHLKVPDSEKKIAEGGLRLNKRFKTNSDSKPLITVVTVAYNDAKSLEYTIRNVMEQSYDNVEYIIVDGGSTDNTLEIMKKYEYAIDYWVSEPDKGIYDAMNKGIALGSGQWINFMNAGDRYYDADILEKIFEHSKFLCSVDIIYGDREVKHPTKKKTVNAGKATKFWKGSQFGHQSALIKMSYHKKNNFNICRKIAADFEFFYRSVENGSEMHYVPYIISNVTSGGVSDVRRIDSILERWLIVDKKPVVNLYYIAAIIAELIKGAAKKYLK